MTTAASPIVAHRQARADLSGLLMTTTRMSVDLVSLSIAVLGGFRCWSFVNPAASSYHASIWLAVWCSFAALAFNDLYPGIGMTAVEQIRRIARGVSLVYLLLTASMFLIKDWWAESRGGFLLSWGLSLILVPLGRWIADSLLGSRSWWGVPVMVLGAGETARTVIRNLRSHHVLGYRPVVCLDDDPLKHGECLGIPVPDRLAAVAYYAQLYQTRRAIVAMPGLERQALLGYLEHWSRIFHRIVLVPNLFGVATLWTEPRDLGGVLGLAIRCNLLNPFNQFIKRAADIVISAVALIASAPLMMAAALWIRKVSPGPAFYSQEREGQYGNPIRVFKLRTMYPRAEEMLRRHLLANAPARSEWERYCKLKNDPRVLPGIGSFLRQTSLDELPQLWNVLRGDMSLVGPRPFPRYHNERFPADFQALRTQVTPGLTGLWQISARSNGDLDIQTSLDTYYIRNWSPWLDLYILVRTVRAVLSRQGAY
jgi:Undecaprenyl-phosphate galactose phosphotransferase WbaP